MHGACAPSIELAELWTPNRGQEQRYRPVFCTCLHFAPGMHFSSSSCLTRVMTLNTQRRRLSPSRNTQAVPFKTMATLVASKVPAAVDLIAILLDDEAIGGAGEVVAECLPPDGGRGLCVTGVLTIRVAPILAPDIHQRDIDEPDLTVVPRAMQSDHAHREA